MIECRIPIGKGVMSSAFAVSVAILLAANDVFGENASIHVKFPALLGPIGGSVRLGGNVDTSKLSHLVG